MCIKKLVVLSKVDPIKHLLIRELKLKGEHLHSMTERRNIKNGTKIKMEENRKRKRENRDREKTETERRKKV